MLNGDVLYLKHRTLAHFQIYVFVVKQIRCCSTLISYRPLADFQICVFVVKADSGLLNEDFLDLKPRTLADFKILVFVVHADYVFFNVDFLYLKHWLIFKFVFWKGRCGVAQR